jgi:hypothetical protein
MRNMATVTTLGERMRVQQYNTQQTTCSTLPTNAAMIKPRNALNSRPSGNGNNINAITLHMTHATHVQALALKRGNEYVTYVCCADYLLLAI